MGAQWIYLACVLPDAPWILRRAASALSLPVDPLELRLYAMAQASLAGCLLLGAALALLSRRPLPIFGVLGANALLHLLLDACEVKWGNGVHLLAPFDWSLTRFELFENDGALNLALTAVGAGLMLVELRRAPAPPRAGGLPRRRALAALLLAGAWLALPLALTPAVLESNSYSVRTLRERAERAGRPVALDRVRLLRDSEGPRIRLWTGERVEATGRLPEGEVRLSLEGRFLAPERLLVERYAVQRFDRDWPSYAGITLLALLWLRPRLGADPVPQRPPS